jgi:hypothetical protein
VPYANLQVVNQEVGMQRALAYAGLLFFIIGIIGIIFTYRLSDWGSIVSIQGNLAFGAFILVGLAILVNLVLSNREIS